MSEMFYESAEMISAFLIEVEEQLEFLEQGILELEQDEENPEVIQKIFRVAHTLKGSSATMGYEKMKSLTHEMENVFDKIRNNLLGVSAPIIDILFKCLDQLKLLKEDFADNKNDTKIEISELVKELKEILGNKSDQKKNEIDLECNKRMESSASSVQADVFFEFDENGVKVIKSAESSGECCLLCKVKIQHESFMKATRACLILNSLNEIGNVITSSPNVLELPDNTDVTVINYLMVTNLNSEELRLKASEFMDVEEVRVTPYELKVTKESRKIDSNKKEEQSTKKKNNHNEKKGFRTVRVDIERLENMMNLVGEMVIEQTRMAQVGNILHSKYSSENTVEDLLGISNRVSRVVSELQEEVMKSRMLPMQQLFNRFPRVVRDLSQALNKEVDLILEGGETEIDRTIIEEITDPLIHIVRNSLDHGIETKESRELKGKTLRGYLKIRAFHQENHVVITIEDDGAGISLKKIKGSAIKKNVITAQVAEALSDREVINLIFETGLSTAENVSDISGRGVGMDIVRNHINKLNGIIDVETKEGEGTKFTIKLPLTLAILTGLLVKIQEETYALPMSNVIEIVRVPLDEIESIKKQSIIVIRGKVHPLIWLHDYFKLPRSKNKRNIFVVVLGTGEKRFAIVVDKLVGNQEIVVKSLGSYIGKVEGISGATILGDGSIACIVDVVGLARIVSRRVVKENINEEDSNYANEKEKR